MSNALREALIVASANHLTAALKYTDDNPLLPPMETQTKQQLTTLAQAFQNALPTLCKKTKDKPEIQTTTTASTLAPLQPTNQVIN